MRHRGWTYIDIAAGVLRNHGKPLGIEEIVRRATEDGVLRSAGQSPESAMRARLSSELRSRGFSSKFQRVGPNRFALREWELPEYIAPPFRKAIPDETVVCVRQEAVGEAAEVFGVTREVGPFIRSLADSDNLLFLPRATAETRNDLRQLVAYALLRDSTGRILTYRRGHYSSAPPMLRGARCLGFGGHVLVEDATNLFGVGDGGVLHAAYREISEELSGTLPTRLDTAALIIDNSSPEGVRHLGLVIDGVLPPNFTEHKSSRERAVNDLQLLTPEDGWRRFHEFEFWSQLVLKNFFPAEGGVKTVAIRPRRRTVESDVFLIAGEIGAGKSTLAESLCQELGFHSVSTRAVVARLLDLPDFEGGDRRHFQEAAARLVSSEEGLRRLSDAIEQDVAEAGRPVVIDGVRQRGTVELLRERFPKLVVLFVDASRDDAFRNYVQASGRSASLDEFRAARSHPVELEVADLKHEADVYIFNGGAPGDMLLMFQPWWVSSTQ